MKANDMTTTTKPQFTTEAITKEISTEAKTTQGNAFFNYFAAKNFTVKLQYGNQIKYKTGDKVSLTPCNGGFAMLDGYNCHCIEAIKLGGVETKALIVPADWIVRREFCIVREYKTTVWEIV